MNKIKPKSKSISVIPSLMPETVLVFLSVDGLPNSPKYSAKINLFLQKDANGCKVTAVEIKIAHRYLNFYLLESSSGLLT
jgi:hypothetical protein